MSSKFVQAISVDFDTQLKFIIKRCHPQYVMTVKKAISVWEREFLEKFIRINSK